MKTIRLPSKKTFVFIPLLLPYVLSGKESVKSTVKLNYAAQKTHQHNKTSLELCSRKMSLAILDSFHEIGTSSTSNVDGVEILCQDMRESSFCHLLMNYNGKAVIHSTVTSYHSAFFSKFESEGIEVDVSISFLETSLALNIEALTQEVLVSLATDGIPKLFSFDPGVDSWWTILPSMGNSDDNVGNTLSRLVLSRAASEVTSKKRLYSSNQIQVWEYNTPKSEAEGTHVISIFINQMLRFTTETMSSIIHAEALVHPVMISHPGPSRVLLVSDFPFAIIDELQKYDASLLERIDVAYASPEVRDIASRYLMMNNYSSQTKIPVIFYNDLDHLPDHQGSDVDALDEFWDIRIHESNDYMDPNKNKHQQTRSICYDEETVLANKRNGYDWERHLICGQNTINKDLKDEEDDDMHSGDREDDLLEYDVILMDVPSYFAMEWLSTALQRKLKGLLDDEDGILAVSIGSPPDISDFLPTPFNSHVSATIKSNYNISVRDTFLREASRHPKNNGIGYKHIAVYDEPLAAPLASAFVVAFKSMLGDSYARFYRTNSAAIDFDIIHRLALRETNGSISPPTIIFDGSTQLHYKIPSRAWEIWYCKTPPGVNLPACRALRSEIFNKEKHKNGVEVKIHPMKGRSVYATESIAVDDFVNIADTTAQFSIDAADFKSLNLFIERFPEATRYKELRDWIVAYGYESLSLGVTGWSASFASTNTFVNHACSELETNVGPCEFLFMSEDDGAVVPFSPVINRHPFLAAFTQCAIRRINAGDELAMDYSAFAIFPVERPYFQLFLTEMCQGGKGLVLGDKDQPGSEL